MEGLSTAAAQVRTFGEIRPGLRYCFEGMGALRTDRKSDAFGAAFPYSQGMRTSETYVEQRLGGKGLIGGVRAGRYRTPFGIYDRGDHAYNGFLRPPLVRWGEYHDLSNYWLEGGVDAFAAGRGLQLEVSLGSPAEDKELKMRRGGLDVAARLQAHRGSLIAGVSFLKTQPDTTEPWVRGQGRFGGVDARDNETEGHSLRVTHYALRLAEQMDLDTTARAALHWGALLHDIGKIGVPDAILHKPGKLTPEEMEIMRRHCEQGLHIVRGIPYLELAADVIGCHHERFDGLGYPAGLAGENIPLTARVFAVADSLDAITSDRPYRRAGTFVDALTEIRGNAGTQFDPSVVRALAGIIEELQDWRNGTRCTGDRPNTVPEHTRQPAGFPNVMLPVATGPPLPGPAEKEVVATA